MCRREMRLLEEFDQPIIIQGFSFIGLLLARRNRKRFSELYIHVAQGTGRCGDADFAPDGNLYQTFRARNMIFAIALVLSADA